MLAALLLAGIVAAPLGSAGLFAGARQHAHVAGPWPATRRLVLALLGTAVLAAAAAAVLLLLHTTEHNLIAGAAGVARRAAVLAARAQAHRVPPGPQCARGRCGHRRSGRGARRGRRGYVPDAGAHPPPRSATQPGRPGARRPHHRAGPGPVPEQHPGSDQQPGDISSEYRIGQRQPVRGAQPGRLGHAIGHSVGHGRPDRHGHAVIIGWLAAAVPPLTVRPSSAG